MAGDAPARVRRRHARLAAEQRDEAPVEVLRAHPPGAVAEEERHAPRRSCGPSSGGWSGRTASHASMACPTSASTGLVNAVPVLWTGTSSKQTPVAACASPSAACVLPADAADAQPHDLVAAQAAEEPRDRQRPDERERVAVARRVQRARDPLGSRWSPAQSSLAQRSSAITRGSGPRRARTLRGVASARVGVEAPRDPAPLLRSPGRTGAASSGSPPSRSPRAAARAGHRGIVALGVLADAHAIDRGHGRGAELPGPGGGLRRLPVVDPEPPTGLAARRPRTWRRVTGVSVDVASQRRTQPCQMRSSPARYGGRGTTGGRRSGHDPSAARRAPEPMQHASVPRARRVRRSAVEDAPARDPPGAGCLEEERPAEDPREGPARLGADSPSRRAPRPAGRATPRPGPGRRPSRPGRTGCSYRARRERR